MWPMIEKRKKSRRLKSERKNQNSDRRKNNRRKFFNWIELFLDDDNPDIS
ncbi:MAG: hypothetical protein JEY91_09625 [Spirochaetaceae bacterium]|nr:hypothetical protein [Spirochaetaceae bacterium]